MFSSNGTVIQLKRRPVKTRTLSKLADIGAELRHGCGLADGRTTIYDKRSGEIMETSWYIRGMPSRVGGPAILRFKYYTPGVLVWWNTK